MHQTLLVYTPDHINTTVNSETNYSVSYNKLGKQTVNRIESALDALTSCQSGTLRFLDLLWKARKQNRLEFSMMDHVSHMLQIHRPKQEF